MGKTHSKKETSLRVRSSDDESDVGDGDVDGSEYAIVRLNVGGVKFNTYRKTLRKQPSCRLANEKFLERHYSEEVRAYFFDRDPDMFKAIMNFLRTGNLHLPSYICGPAAREELEYWGLLPNTIEKCCWMNYNEWNSAQVSLQQLEKDRKLNSTSYDQPAPPHNASWWAKLRPRVWRMMNRSNSSLAAKIFSVVSLIFVIVSILSFLAETTKPFKNYGKHQVNTSTVSIGNGGNNTTSQPMGGVLTLTTEEQPTLNKHPVLLAIDVCCLTYFIIEYVIRFIFAPKKLKNVTSLLSVIDVLAILPDLIELGVYLFNPALNDDVTAVNYITVLRVIRVLRIFRLIRHSTGLWILIYTLRASFSELMLLVWFMALGILLFASLIYYAEDQPEHDSIPSWFWWALITMTTVGYGDMYPYTIVGKLVGSLCAMCGVLMIGFTVPALVNNFMLYYRHLQFAMQVESMEREVSQMQARNGTTPDARTCLGGDSEKNHIKMDVLGKRGFTSQTGNGSSEVKTPLVSYSGDKQ